MDEATNKQSCLSTACKSLSENNNNSVEKNENHSIIFSEKKDDFNASNQSLQIKSVSDTLQTHQCVAEQSTSSAQSITTFSSSEIQQERCRDAAYNSCSNTNGILTNPGSGGIATPHYYSQILNTPQSLLRPLITTQPPLYSPILTSQQHTYGIPHPSPSSSSFSSMSDSVRTIEQLSCASEAVFKETTHPSRLNKDTININNKSCSIQNSTKQYQADASQKRANTQSSCNLARFSSCAEVVTKQNNAEQQQMFEDYVKMYGEDANCRSWSDVNASASNQNSSHHRNSSYVAHQPGTSLNVHGYSDCRLDPSWNRYMSGQSSNCISESYATENNSPYSKHIVKGYSAVSNSGNHTSTTEHNLSRSHYEFQPISAGQLASLLTTYMQPVGYQHPQDCRNEYRATDLRTNENQLDITGNAVQTAAADVPKKSIEIASSHAADTSQGIPIASSEDTTSHILPNSSHIASAHIQSSPDITLTTTAYQESQHSISKNVQSDKKANDPSVSQSSTQTASNCQAGSGTKFSKNSTERESLDSFKKQNEKSISEEGNALTFFCLLCGESVNDSPTHSQIDNIITYASKISINEKLTLMIGYPLPRDMLPSQSICPKCFRLINEVDVLENRLNVCRREVLLAIESMFERNGIHFSPYKRFQRQQYVGSYQHHEMQHTTYQCLGSNGAYQNEAQGYQSLNHIYPVHNQTNQTHLMHQSQMHLPQNHHQNIHLHAATLTNVNHVQEQQAHVDENHLSNHQESYSHIQHQPNQVQQDGSLKGVPHDLNKITLESDPHKQQQHHQSHHQLHTTSVQTQSHQQQHHQVLSQHHHETVHEHQLQAQNHHSVAPSVSQNHNLTQNSSQIQITQQVHENYNKQLEQTYDQRSHLGHAYYHNGSAVSQSIHSNQVQSSAESLSQSIHSNQVQSSAESLSQSIHSNQVQSSAEPLSQSIHSNQGHSSSEPLSQSVHNNQLSISSTSSKSDNSSQQALNAYHQQLVSDSATSIADTTSHLPHSLNSKDVTQALSEPVQSKDKPKSNSSANQVILIQSPSQIPLILPETSNELDSQSMSVLLSYQHNEERVMHNEERVMNTELLGSNFAQAYSNVTSVDPSTNQNQSDKSLPEPADLVHPPEKEFSKVQNIDVENWSSCNDSGLENVGKSVSSNHPECDIDIEECDNIIENAPNEQSVVCNNEMFLKAEGEESIVKSTENENANVCDKSSNEPPLLSGTSEDNEFNDILIHPPFSPPPPPNGPPEGLRNVQDATEYHKPTLLGKNIKVKKHAKLQICRQCDQVFSNRQALIRHIERRHKNVTLNYTCDTCHRKFNSERTLKQHARTHKTYPCNICSKIFLKKTKLKKHLKEHSQKCLTCKVCGKEASSMPALISHIKAHEREPKSYICSMCSKQFTCKRNLDQHSLIHTGEKPFSCENCGRVFRNRGNMVNHFSICTGKFRFMCSVCGKGFALKCLHERHLAEHEGRYAHCCSICHKGFGKSSDLRKHFNSHGVVSQIHSKPCTVCSGDGVGCNKSRPREAKSVCKICGKNVNSKGTMKDHMAFHAGERHHTCHVCSVSYFYKSNLTFHINTVHLKKLPFPCTLCCKAFSKPGNYKLHMRTHTGEKPYQCKSCGKAFSTSSNYKRHLKCHVTHARINNKSADE